MSPQMISKALLLGFIAAVSAQSSGVTDSMTQSVTDSMTSTATESMTSSVMGDPAVIDSSAAPSTATWSYFNTTVTSTVVVAELVTVCPSATTYNFNGVQYPATEGETITVNNCPCTLTTAIPTLTSTICTASGTGVTAPTQAAASDEASAPPVDNVAPASAPGSASGTSYVAPSAPSTGNVEVSGASSSGSAKVGVAGAALAGLLGLLVL